MMDEKGPDQRFQITKLRVKNFRSIRDVELDLGLLTMLVGQNASGKSNLMDVLRFVSDAVRRDLDFAVTRRHGLEALACRQSEVELPNIEIGLEVTVPRHSIVYSFVMSTGPDGGVAVAREWGEVTRLGDGSAPVHFRIEEGNIVAPDFLSENLDQVSDQDSHFDSTNLALSDLRRMVRFNPRVRALGDCTLILSSGLRELEASLRQLRFYQIVPNIARRPQRILSPSPLAPNGNNLASVLREIQMNDEETKQRLVKSLIALIPTVSDFRVETAGGFLVVELKHSVPSCRESTSWFDLTQESDGTVYILGLLAALNQRRYSRLPPYPVPPLIGIEEPELFVHPGALEALADNFKEASEPSQVLLTTHSPDLIDQFKTVDLRVVQMMNGITEVGQVSREQAETVRKHLFSAGELHSMEGLRLDLEG
jgi:predicted ATPase